VRESVTTIRAAGATPAGVVLALDRQERGPGQLSAVQEVQASFSIPVIKIINLDHLIEYLEAGDDSDELASLKNHRRTYCVDSEA
jgi:orotate phosphoribosyltransferase